MLASTNRSRASMPTSRMLFTAIRTIDSQSLHPVGDLMYIVGSRCPARRGFRPARHPGPTPAVYPASFSVALAFSGSNDVPYFFASSSE